MGGDGGTGLRPSPFRVCVLVRRLGSDKTPRREEDLLRPSGAGKLSRWLVNGSGLFDRVDFTPLACRGRGQSCLRRKQKASQFAPEWRRPWSGWPYGQEAA
jgi:hypothetical protein